MQGHTFSEILQIVLQGVTACINWVDQIFDSIGAWPFIWGTLSAMLVFRYIILPMMEGVAIHPERTTVHLNEKQRKDIAALRKAEREEMEQRSRD